jgi:hypothetical protein
MLEALKAWAEPIAKAIVAAVIPVVTPILIEVVADAEVFVVGLITAAATTIGVWAVPNKPSS